MPRKKAVAPEEAAVKEEVVPVAAEGEAPVKKTRKRTVKAEPAAEAEAPVKKTRKRAVKAETAEGEAPVKKTRKKAVKPVEEPVVEAVAEPVVEAVAEPVVEAVAEPVVEAVAEPVVEVAAEPVVEPVVEAVVEPVVEAVVEPVAEVAEAVEDVVVEIVEEPVEEPAAVEEPVEEPAAVEEPVYVEPELPQPRRSVAFIGSECYPFVKTGGLGDVMYALPRALVKQNCDVKVILPRYKCIPQKYQDKMVYRGDFIMDLCADGRSFYVGIMEYVWDGVVYDFIDNEEFFSFGKPYTNLVDDIPKYCFFSKAALAALNYLDWVPDIIHCHDWQAGLVPLYLRTLFAGTPVGSAKSVITIHNLRFQGVYNIPTLRYWSGLPEYVFNPDVMTDKQDANMFKAGLTYCDKITTVSQTYAWEIQTPFFGENLDAHLRHHAGKLSGIVNGIDVDIWNPATDALLPANYSVEDAIAQKKIDKTALQERLGLEVDENKMVLGLISRLTDQKGLDLFSAIMPALIDGNTQVVVLGTGDAKYEWAFRDYENRWKGSVCSYIAYDESLAHEIYAGSDALLVPSLFEPCGLTQLIAMRYGTVPIVRETGGLKDTVQPYNEFTNEGNGFTFDRYEAGLLLDAVNRAKTVYFTERERWDEMVLRDLEKDVSWDKSAKQYRELYLELKP